MNPTTQQLTTVITLLIGGLILSNFYDLLTAIKRGDWIITIQQFINLVGLLGIVWLHFWVEPYLHAKGVALK